MMKKTEPEKNAHIYQFILATCPSALSRSSPSFYTCSYEIDAVPFIRLCEAVIEINAR